MPETATIELPSQDPMLRAVGAGIQRFASVEHGLSILFADLMEPADRQVSVLVMDAVRNVETKIQIVQAAVDAKLTGSQLTKGRKIVDLVRKRGDMRNKLAHWTVTLWPGVSTAAEMKKMIVVLAPPIYSKHWGPVMFAPKTTTIQPIRLKQVETFLNQCSALFAKMVDFSAEISPPKDGTKKPEHVAEAGTVKGAV